ncbi:MAG: AMP-binding protein [Paracoccaceae bacterium]
MAEEHPKTLSQLLSYCSAKYGDRPALTSRVGLRTRVMSYRELAEAAESIAGDLVNRHGLKRGQRVILQAPSSVHSVAALFGLFRAGLIVTPMDMNASSSFLSAVRKTSGAVAILSPKVGTIPGDVPHLALESLDFEASTEKDLPAPAPDDVAEIVYTSGTTGHPKGVTLSHRNIISDLEGVMDLVPPGEDLRLVSILPLSHMFEQMVGLYLPLRVGGTVHYAPSLRPSAIKAEISRRHATAMVVVPRFLELLMSAAADRASSRGLERIWSLQHRVSSKLPMILRRAVFYPLHRGLGGKLRYFFCGGAALQREVMEAWERTGIRILEGYGATECSPVVTSNTLDDRVPGSIGRPIEGVELRLSDEGELQVRGDNVFAGYWKDDERTKAAFTADGWYKTDDIAEPMEHGRWRIIGRLSDRIVLPNGMNVFPADVEAEISRQMEIAECVVLGITDPDKGTHIHAAIHASEGEDEAGIAKAIERANSALASHQRVTGFTIWHEDFPKTALQKVKRQELRKALEGRVKDGAPTPKDSAGDLLERLLRQVSKTAAGKLSPDMSLDLDLGIDSLGRVELAAEIEKETGRDVPEEDIAKLATVGDLAEFLAQPGRQMPDEGLASWPRSLPMSILRRAIQPALLFLPHAIWARPFRVTGLDALAGIDPPFLMVSNHASHADTISILRGIPPHLRDRTAIAAAADYFFANRFAAMFAAAVLGAFPFSREGRVRESLENCGRLADEGYSILIYPEGTRSPDGRLLPFKMGIGLLVRGLDVPVVPMAVTGGAKLLPKGSTWPRRTPVSVRFGQALTIPSDMTPDQATALLQRRVADVRDTCTNDERAKLGNGSKRDE